MIQLSAMKRRHSFSHAEAPNETLSDSDVDVLGRLTATVLEIRPRSLCTMASIYKSPYETFEKPLVSAEPVVGSM